MYRFYIVAIISFVLAMFANASADELQHGFAKNGDVKIHYVSQGSGPLVVMLHGFPDFWYTWRNQMPELSKTHRVVAIDQRGYNKSDKPEGVGNYKVEKLTSDVKAVIEHLGAKNATVVGHDWPCDRAAAQRSRTAQ